ncbi:MAG TPA: DNA adenine methylase [Ignavibacteria bacterium]|nr:DNA adenine methylase [Ignavibacteria bacterium]
MIKSPLRYPGGKSKAVDLISKLIPEFDEFREPFVGGGSVFIYTKQKYPDKTYWINDIYFELFKFWEISQKDIHSLTDKIYEWRNKYSVGKDLHRYLNKNLNTFNDIERAAAFFIFNRITFSGTSLSGGYSEASFKGRFTESSIVRLYEFAKLLNGSKITNLDYREVVNKDGENVFIFLDPPYFSATKSALYGKNGNLHKLFNHQIFAETMKKNNHKWLITYDDCEYIRSLFSFANIIPWDLTYGMRNVVQNSDKTGKELFISNYLTEIPQSNQFSMAFDYK